MTEFTTIRDRVLIKKIEDELRTKSGLQLSAYTKQRPTKGTVFKITNEQEKLSATRLLNDLVHEVKNMDNMHVDMIYANQLPTMGNEMRDRIGSIRKTAR